MPPGRPRKEPKETVTYPASKRKAPPFKPQRPSQVPRAASATESENSGRLASRTPSGANQAGGKINAASTGFTSAGKGMFRSVSATSAKGKGKVKSRVGEDDDEEEAEEEDEAVVADAGCKPNGRPTQPGDDISDPESEDDALEDPMTISRKPPPAPKPAPRAPADQATKRQPTAKPAACRDPSPMSISSYDHYASDDVPLSPSADRPPAPSQTDPAIPSIPRPLLLRLMHEHFNCSTTKIDKHAVSVLERYLNVFLREAIARAKIAKKEDVRAGLASQDEENWLEKADLEKVVAGLVLDF